MTNLKMFIRNTWDGDVTYSEAIENFTYRQKYLMEMSLTANRKLIQGLPEDFKPQDEGEELLQLLVDTFD